MGGIFSSPKPPAPTPVKVAEPLPAPPPPPPPPPVVSKKDPTASRPDAGGLEIARKEAKKQSERVNRDRLRIALNTGNNGTSTGLSIGV